MAITRAFLKIINSGAAIEAVANSMATDPEFTFDLEDITVPRNMMYVEKTKYTSINFDLDKNPYVSGSPAVPEKIKKVRVSFNENSFLITAAEIGKGVDLDGTEHWFTDDGLETGKPDSELLYNWLRDKVSCKTNY